MHGHECKILRKNANMLNFLKKEKKHEWMNGIKKSQEMQCNEIAIQTQNISLTSN